jgi:L-threonylcarbamoyladenylate synthase
MTSDEVAAFRECLDAGGVAVFPADTVYGLACDPENERAVRRLYELKGRPPERPAAVMFFDADPLAELLNPRTHPNTVRAVVRLLPGPVTVLVPNSQRHFPLACGPEPETLGLRVPHIAGHLEGLDRLGRPILQSSANLSGGLDPLALGEVPEAIRAGADLVLEADALPYGRPSTVIDLRTYERDGAWSVIREGALPAAEIALD